MMSKSRFTALLTCWVWFSGLMNFGLVHGCEIQWIDVDQLVKLLNEKKALTLSLVEYIPPKEIKLRDVSELFENPDIDYERYWIDGAFRLCSDFGPRKLSLGDVPKTIRVHVRWGNDEEFLRLRPFLKSLAQPGTKTFFVHTDREGASMLDASFLGPIPVTQLPQLKESLMGYLKLRPYDMDLNEAMRLVDDPKWFNRYLGIARLKILKKLGPGIFFRLMEHAEPDYVGKIAQDMIDCQELGSAMRAELARVTLQFLGGKSMARQTAFVEYISSLAQSGLHRVRELFGEEVFLADFEKLIAELSSRGMEAEARAYGLACSKLLTSLKFQRNPEEPSDKVIRRP